MILDLDGGCQGLDWTFVGNRRLTMISTNDVYHKVIGMYSWMEEKFTKEWESHKPISWWHHMLRVGRQICLTLRPKVFE